MKIEDLARLCVRKLTPYSSARDEFSSGDTGGYTFLDANEAWCDAAGGSVLNRYPDSSQKALRAALSKNIGLPLHNIFVGNGSDEAIELLIEIFCEPGIDEVLVTPPTYGMYRVSAEAHGARVCEAPLRAGFELDRKAIVDAITEQTKVVFICSPNNPTGNVFDHKTVLSIFDEPKFKGIVVVDEAYVEFCPDKSYLKYLASYERLVILRTFSKAWGLAGARVGMALAGEEIIKLFMRKKPPYNVNTDSQVRAQRAVGNVALMEQFRDAVVAERGKVAEQLERIRGVVVFPSETNFLLVKIKGATDVYKKLIERKIIVRDRSKEFLCHDTLRITIGSPEENQQVCTALKEIVEG